MTSDIGYVFLVLWETVTDREAYGVISRDGALMNVSWERPSIDNLMLCDAMHSEPHVDATAVCQCLSGMPCLLFP